MAVEFRNAKGTLSFTPGRAACARADPVTETILESDFTVLAELTIPLAALN